MHSRARLAFGAFSAAIVAVAPFGSAAAAPDELFASFLQPPPQAYPSGNAGASAPREALRAQLERQKAMGTNHASIGGNYPNNGYMTPAWSAGLASTFAYIGSMGFTTGFNVSPGFSHTGDFFVQPEEAMKKLVWTRTTVQGGQPFSGRLAAPPFNSGPFQNLSQSNETPATIGIERDFYKDVMVLAYRLPDSSEPTAPATVTSSIGPIDAARLSTLDPKNPINLKARDGAVWLQFDYPSPQTIRTVSIATREMRIDGSMGADLQARGDDGQYRNVVTVNMRNISHVTTSFAPVRSTSFRLVFRRAPPLYRSISTPGETISQNVNPFSLKGSPDTFPIAGAWLQADGVVNEYERKAGFYAMVENYYALATPPGASNGATPKTQVIDITDRMRPDGAVDWTPPAGRWAILRLGYSMTGKDNHPAPPEQTGLEVDKLSAAHMAKYLNRFFEGIMPKGPERKFVTTVFSDSIESGPQNWTQDMLSEFRKRRGYDAKPYLPALTGAVIESAAASDKFLWDYRQTIAELMAENTYGKINEVANRYGVKTIVEALEQNRHQLGDDYQMRRYADMPAAAIWSGPGRVDYLQNAPQQVADMRGAASVAHVYGRQFVASESGTNLNNPFNFSPRNLKPMVDLEFVLGMNWMLRGAPAANETWASYSGDWVRYLTRSSFMMQQGRYVADVAYYFGQEAPLIQLRQRLNDAPTHYGFDYLNTEALMQAVKVTNGRLRAPSGIEYRVLQIGGNSDMLTTAVLRRLRDLVQSGLVVVGKPPSASPSLADDPTEFTRLQTQLWGRDGKGAKLGKGRVYGAATVEEALAAQGMAPDLTATGATVGSDLLYMHRRMTDGDVYYVMNNVEQARPVELSFRVTGKAPELWRADTGERTPLAYRSAGGRTIVPVRFRPNDAAFIVFRKPTKALSRVLPATRTETLAHVDGPWQVSFPAGRGAPDQPVNLNAGSLSEQTEPGLKYFSGTATYSRTLDVPATALSGGKVLLSLGEVRDIAEVRVNGTPVGVRWTAPYSFDISKAAKPGANTVEVKTTNIWVNRLIGDQQPGAKPIAPAFGAVNAGAKYRPDAQLRPSGLIGPVILVHEN